MDKPKYLYHGDRKHLEILEPRQAVGFGGDEDCRKAVYAVSVREWAIPFAITFVPTAKDAVFSVDTESSPPRIHLKNTDVRWTEIGYVYTLPADTFEKIDEKQWISYSPVEPVLVEKIAPIDFQDWIEIDKP